MAILRTVLVLLALAGVPAVAMAQATEGDDAPLRFGRFEAEGKVRYGYLSVGGIHEIDRSYFEPDAVVTGRVFPLEAVKMLAPVVPGKVIALAQSYKGEPAIKGMPEGPVAFAKLPTAVIGGDAAIVVPPGIDAVAAAGEVVLVIGKPARNVSEAEAMSHVAGVTAGLDVSAGVPAGALPSLATTGRDTFAPLGPWIVPGLYYDRLRLQVSVNGKPVGKGSTSALSEPVAKIVARLSTLFTLEPGDVIFTGTAAPAFPLKAGDSVEVELEGVGALRNTVVAAPP
jgi:2-keto-4-pentenoate hydratase/2-oxohepta-3-ene-1,7-dioic acid hydratase in catechol pathway